MTLERSLRVVAPSNGAVPRENEATGDPLLQAIAHTPTLASMCPEPTAMVHASDDMKVSKEEVLQSRSSQHENAQSQNNRALNTDPAVRDADSLAKIPLNEDTNDATTKGQSLAPESESESIAQQNLDRSSSENSSKKENFQYLIDKLRPYDGRPHRDEEILDGPSFAFVVGADPQNRTELSVNKGLICRHSSWINRLCEEGKRSRAHQEALKRMSHKLKHAIIKAGDHPQIPRPRTEEARPLRIYYKAIVDVCNEYPWAKTCEYFSQTIATALGISQDVFQRKKKEHVHLLQVIRPVLEDIDLQTVRNAVKIIGNRIKGRLSDTGDHSGPLAAVRAAGFNKMYLRDADAATVALLIEQLESEDLDVVPTHQLIGLYAFGENLCMPDFQNKIMDNLRCMSRHGPHLTALETIHFLCEYAPESSPLYQLVVDALVYAKPGLHVLQVIKATKNFGLACGLASTLMARLQKATRIEEDGPPYFNPEESCKRYHVHEVGKRCI